MRGVIPPPPPELEGWDARRILDWALKRFEPRRLVLACSFGVEDVVLVDLCAELGRFPRVVTLDTGRLPDETHQTIEAVRARYGLQVDVLFPDAGRVEEMTRAHGPNLFYRSVELRRLCCAVRKVEVLRRALSGAQAWITGLRRDQSPERSAVLKSQWDGQFGLLKLAPLADWTAEAVWGRARERGLPYNPLHDRGYPSIGCSPCTRAVAAGEDERAGRWWWESSHKECGLHPPAV